MKKEVNSMSSKRQWRPGEEAEYDLELYVVDGKGNQLGEISVPKGNRIPPTRIEDAEGYIEK